MALVQLPPDDRKIRANDKVKVYGRSLQASKFYMGGD